MGVLYFALPEDRKRVNVNFNSSKTEWNREEFENHFGQPVVRVFPDRAPEIIWVVLAAGYMQSGKMYMSGSLSHVQDVLADMLAETSENAMCLCTRYEYPDLNEDEIRKLKMSFRKEE